MSKADIATKMKALVLAYRESGQTRKTFAWAHGISEPKLTYWIKKFSKSGATPKKLPSSSGFVPIEVDPAPLNARGHLLIRLPSGVEIEIPL